MQSLKGKFIKRIEDLSFIEKLKDHRRFKVYYQKGTNCICCGKIGKFVILSATNKNALHWDLYTEDLELMTIDHIKPKSKGGGNNIENLQPMCAKCNTKKSNNYEEN